MKDEAERAIAFANDADLGNFTRCWHIVPHKGCVAVYPIVFADIPWASWPAGDAPLLDLDAWNEHH